ncbi:MAG: type I 3-dehydroquinate dehydratase [Methanosphaera sp. rholeuAM270]|nr:MAG: type I 3-dehydroquinate dehydratase [Methanosphaera sp. rholeuAM270]
MKINTGVCASIIEDNKENVLNTIKQLPMDYVEYIELRLDTINNLTSSDAEKIIKSVKDVTSTPLILTNRTKREGGFFEGSEAERIKILKDNASLVEITDIELMTDNNLLTSVVKEANKSIISYHNFYETPSYERLQTIVDRASELGDIPKVAVKPNSMEDTYILLRLLMENRGIIGISMDSLGSYTRIIAPLMGSPVTYASLNKESAPGQLDIKTTYEMIKKLQH